MADATATLRTARGALQEGLITDADYEAVKAAFLKAQQFKAGLDAGFITEADYNDVKSRFLDAFYGLNVSGDGGSSGYPSPARPSSPALAPGSPAGSSRQLQPQGPPPGHGGMQQQQPAAPVLGPRSDPPPAGGTPGPSPPVSARGSAGGDGSPNVPSNIPSLGGALRKKNSGPQTSMSGIAVADDAVNLFYYMKAKSAYRWAMWGVNAAGTEIVIVDVGRKDSPYEEFILKLPPNDCRFAVYDYQVTNSEGRVFDKLVFFSWSPDTARIRTKMMYASTKDFFKSGRFYNMISGCRSFLEGLSVELQVSDIEEITEKDIHEHVLSVLTRP